MNPGDIPCEPLNLRTNDCGLLPQTALYRRHGIYRQAASRAHLWLAVWMVAAAIIVALLPWETRAIVGKLKYWVAGGLMWGALCSVGGYLLVGTLSQVITIDPAKRTLCITSDAPDLKLDWDQIVGLQICRQHDPGDSEVNGYQLNLVWTAADGAVKRHCLMKHTAKICVMRMGKRYESLFGFRLMDHGTPGIGSRKL